MTSGTQEPDRLNKYDIDYIHQFNTRQKLIMIIFQRRLSIIAYRSSILKRQL